jgi:pSer/pThr/pTyr-binding forkhead associated (FHA) protein
VVREPSSVGVLGGLHSATPLELRLRRDTERRGEPFIVYRDGTGTQLIVQLPADRDRVTIGRRPSNDLVLDFDTEVSRVHVELQRISGDWCLTDDGLSRNGSFVNRQLVTARVKLGDGDLIRLGRTHLLFFSPNPGSVRSDPTATSKRVAERALTPTQRAVLIALCRPLVARPAGALPTNGEIGKELALSEQAVKANLRALFAVFEVQDEPQNRKRQALATAALNSSTLSPSELATPGP